MTPATPGGRRYFLLLVDDASRYMWAVLLPSKDAAADAIKKVQAEVEKESGHKLRVLRTDNGGEFTVVEFAAYCTDEGIKHHFSTRHSPQQNIMVERWNQTMVATAWALLRQRRLLAKYWGEAVMTAIHLLNRSPTRPLRGLARAHAHSELSKTFGCVAYTKDLGQLRKLDDCGKPGVFISYAEGAKVYWILGLVI
jgi:transposase InsO family protein